MLLSASAGPLAMLDLGVTYESMNDKKSIKDIPFVQTGTGIYIGLCPSNTGKNAIYKRTAASIVTFNTMDSVTNPGATPDFMDILKASSDGTKKTVAVNGDEGLGLLSALLDPKATGSAKKCRQRFNELAPVVGRLDEIMSEPVSLFTTLFVHMRDQGQISRMESIVRLIPKSTIPT